MKKRNCVKMNAKLLQIIVEVWDEDTTNKVYDLFKGTSYITKYWKGIAPPNKVEFILAPLSDLGVENWLNSINEIEGIKYTHTVLDYKDRSSKQ